MLTAELAQLVHSTLAKYPQEVETYRNAAESDDDKNSRRTQSKLQKLFIGKCMKASQGLAQPQRLAEVLEGVLHDDINR